MCIHNQLHSHLFLLRCTCCASCTVTGLHIVQCYCTIGRPANQVNRPVAKHVTEHFVPLLHQPEASLVFGVVSFGSCC